MLETRIATLEEKLRSATGDRPADSRPTSFGSARTSTSRTRPASRPSTRSSARPRPTPPRAKLSNESPVGKALLGRKRGDEVVIVHARSGERASSRSPRSTSRRHNRAWAARVSDASDGADELLAARRRKLEALRDAGVDPFPHEFDGCRADRGRPRGARRPRSRARRPRRAYRVAGRLAARRGQGKMAFLDLVDRSGRIQLQARDDVLGRGDAASACSASTSAT